MTERSKQIVMGRESQKTPVWIQWGALTVLGGLAFAFRLIAIGQESFWTDEVLSLNSLRIGVWRWIWNTECHPPLFFLLLKGWSLLFGQGHVALRAFSTLAGAAAVPLLWLCARRWRMGPWASAAAALILLIHPFATLHSQQNRYYALLMLLGVAWLATLPALSQPNTRRLRYSFLLAGFAAFLTHYYFAFLALGGGLGMLLGWALTERDRRVLRRILLNFFVLGLLMATLLPLMIHQRRFIPAHYLAPPDWPQLASVFARIFWVGPWNETTGWVRILIVIMTAAALGGHIRGAIRRLRGTGASAAAGPAGVLFFFCGVVPILVAFCFSHWVSPMFIADRYMILFLPAFILWLVLGWAALLPAHAAPWLLGALVTGFALVTLPSHQKYWTQYQEYDWRGSIRAVEAQWRPGDAMVFCPDWLGGSYLDNGGELKNVLGAQDGHRMAQAGRIWLFLWEQAPAETGRAAWQEVRERQGNPFVIHFPHITLSLIDPARVGK